MLNESSSRLRHGTLAGQGLRFAAAGGCVAVVYLGSTSLLSEVIGLKFEIALAIGFALAITTHFTLQRLFVWSHSDGYALALRAQIVRYLMLAGVQYGITAAATATLPKALGVATEIVYVITAGLLTVMTFFLLRTRVFHLNDSPTAA